MKQIPEVWSSIRRGPRPSGLSKLRLQGGLGLDLRLGFFRRSLVVRPRDEDVERWDDKKSKDGADAHAADEDETDRVSRGGARAAHEGEGKVTRHSRDGCHHDGT